MKIKDKYLNKDGSINESKLRAKIEQLLSPAIDRAQAYIDKTIKKRFIEGRNSDDGSDFANLSDNTVEWRRWKGGGDIEGKPLNFTGGLRRSNKVVRKGLKIDIVNNNPYSELLNEGLTGARGGGTQPIPARRHLDVPDEVNNIEQLKKIVKFDEVQNEFAKEIFEKI